MRSPQLEDAKGIPEEFAEAVMQVLLGLKNYSATEDYSAPYLKPVVARIYPLFILLYAIPTALGLTLNVMIIVYISKYKLFRDVTHAFIVNLAVCHCVQCAFVLPITLMVMLIHNWVFGQFLCFFLPLLQDIPLHVAMLSHLLIAWDRKRWLTDPLKVRLPAFVCSCASWLAGLVIALPYPIYTTFLDLEPYLPGFAGVGICAVNLVDDMQEYMRGLFVIMYCAPMSLLGYLYIRTSRELRPPDGPLSIMMFEARAEARSRQIRLSTGCQAGGGASSIGGSTNPASTTSAAASATLGGSSRTYDLYDAEADVNREKRTQRHLGAMASSQVLCVCPLMILRLARMTVAETYENQAHYDITFLMFVWIAFLPTIIVPWIYASWVLSKPTKERLRGYLRLSSRRNTGTRSEQSLDDPGSTPPGQASKKALPLATPMPSIGPAAGAISTADTTGSSHRRSTSGRSGRGPILSADRLHLQADTTATTSMMHDDSKSPASNSARTVETTISRQSSMAGRPRRQLPPPLRIEESNFHRTPSVQSGRTPSSGVNAAAHNSSIRSTASRVSSTAPLYRRYSRSQPQPPSMPDDDAGDDVSSLVGNSSDVTSSTYCVLPESAAHYVNDPLSVAPAHRHLSGSSATYRRRSSAQTQASHLSAQSHATSASSASRGRRGSAGTEDREATDELLADDDVSEIFSSVSQPSARKPVGILKATPSIASISESEYSSRKGSFSTLSRDLEIIDQLERERSMDIQEMIQREKSYEQYLVRQNSKLKFSTNFDEYFESAAVREAAAAASGGAGDGSPQPSHQGGSAQLPLQPMQAAGTVAQLPTPASRGGSLSPHSRARSPMHRRSSQLSGPPASAGYAGEMGVGERQQAAFGPRRSIELERRFHRTYSTSGSTRSGSTRSRDRITFQDQV
ncbi:G-protein coupled receptor moody [Anopheles ziemanni]|uniref:G-protein coupled receptor moody n=1 Tax=Anopheles coustani TaxID=139045 RepID=UPI00265A0B68|nr:G-protein coupled receptor moody [Anopheles coustani]XP_058176502.1 G-protein coupled receptor moody [Anopheles ziemanni]